MDEGGRMMGGGDWRSQGLCARVQDVDAAWVPADKGTHRTQRQVFNAVKVCDACPVRDVCLAHALAFVDTRDQTIYGGLSRLQRRLLIKMMREHEAPGIPSERARVVDQSHCQAYLSWINEHPESIEQVREQSQQYWAKYRKSYKRGVDFTLTCQA
jgi:hypothetical protein